MDDFDFRDIAPHCGGQRDAFEELSCQLAHRTQPEGSSYTRLHGAGGDGGVECFVDLADGARLGWQAKYVFDIGSLLTQATKSLITALSIHASLTKYIVCFPFDLTGPTGRRGKSGKEKFDDWCQENEARAIADGRQLTIEAWPASKLKSLMLEFDASGGIRAFFFSKTVLTTQWFSQHLDTANDIAGPRYTPELNVKTDLWKWFAAFGRTTEWSAALNDRLRSCRNPLERLSSAVRKTDSDSMSPRWPNNLQSEAQTLVDAAENLVEDCKHLIKLNDASVYKCCVDQLVEILGGLTPIEVRLTEDLEEQHGQGRADSPGFRQFMAEYMVSFPAANLDYVRDLISALGDLHDWLSSSACSLAFQHTFVLTGVAGSGKTHGVCDAARYRFNNGLLTCVVFGHTFGGEPDPWTRIVESLGLPMALGMEGVLGALNAAGEATGFPLMLCIDALNETRPLRYWRDRLAGIVQAVQNRPYLRLCVTCRSSFLPYCLPDGHDLQVIEHLGFAGVERDACKAFFQYYSIEPPITPILQPELSNPLYLRLVCETLHSRGLDRLPSGWLGIAPAIRAFLDEKEKMFAAEYETAVGAYIVAGALKAIARAIVDSGNTSLAWSHAQRVVSEERPQAATLPVLEWLVRGDLLIEDISDSGGPVGEESTVRPSFERLGDFLIADELLSRTDLAKLKEECRPDGLLYRLLGTAESVQQNTGVISALSILIPEKVAGKELASLIEDESVSRAVLKITVESFPWRDTSTLTSSSTSLMYEALRMEGFSWDAMDAALSISWQPSPIDATWIDNMLKQSHLAARDAFWCGFLHNRYEAVGPVRRLIDAAFELPLGQVEADIAERWATVLLWFTAAADRRVKDRSTRAVVALLAARPEVIPIVLSRLLESDDDEIRERALLSSYGALINAQDLGVLKAITSDLQMMFRRNPLRFDNALVRDQIRCITELAHELDALSEGCEPELTMQPIGSAWPLDIPSDEDVKKWDDLPKLSHSCLEDDFYVYSMGCLRPWEHAVPKNDMGKWILNRVADGFAYVESGCENYDKYMLGSFGGGRGKKTWAERIGKKYQWVALYQLASCLHDHVDRKRDSWDPELQRTPLILLEERKLDATLPSFMIGGERDADAWWIGSSANLRIGEHLSDDEWVDRQEDLPSLEDMLAVQQRDNQRWRLLVSYPSWGNRDEDAGWNDPYRQVWVHLESYLISKDEVELAYNSLHRRNFFGQWMPQGASWLYGFAGEYPWATPFNTEPEEWHGRGGFGDKLSFSCIPSWSDLAVEWEYDASLPGNFHMSMPARAFFASRDLWWDGRDGYRLMDGRTVFRDPSVTESGPKALIADSDDLLVRLDKLGLCLMWTLLGEKWILGGSHDKPTPRRTFSQVARLNEDGSVEIGERVFFNDYDQDAGPLKTRG
ncbi:MAG: hypothetical protein JAZ17_17865 [Candidatus Thiodiazotropha endolucinida]|nr:hypothetical protein [Candidatus Thiodiazotropha taylori]MCG8095457.1 hypothetical protein [Candidatus Thiodiazotropha endolucinida]MCW4268600.1 hypothetical protein [Candidatus Thiodiazotropha endolucinida]